MMHPTPISSSMMAKSSNIARAGAYHIAVTFLWNGKDDDDRESAATKVKSKNTLIRAGICMG